MADTVLGAGGTPVPAGAAHSTEQVTAALSAIERSTQRLLQVSEELDDASVRRPSLLPGWTRAHVLTHLARNADGLLNLLIWARTGAEHPMYASPADRDADIQEGAVRGHRLLVEDVVASHGRFAHAVRTLPASAWDAEVVGREPMPAHHVLRKRLLELWVHLVDLDGGVGFDEVPEADAEQLLEDVVQQFGGRPDVPAVTVVVDFDDGRTRTWELRGTTSPPAQVRGRPGPMLGWLLGRTGPEPLEGDAPALPVWL
ncbi:MULTISPECIES: maleylpyruvate isomerase family mycothiol-dependent enzyme [Saccharopolyspora]|uniref:Maleylpyruvate isomerase family mycothiol-dependent enzyme n=1 Tax=Saccharopolyspora gregorii TaxID=33914 RepID=A0ABP6RSH1_9PSEU|nr:MULTISPECIES: maleylpyruvate isomerase family mycothiol-dependent enzyme [Saccharopolyspora]MCA1188043.1 maleylpyruvate isomerase family mycothiol-dependent enzyme [Saccharopolyspora sp. 6T]MCA1195993.1 maleylpyruvate isomerase family mycothiol-dependent enzyme [Saccharopolyspora sp. 6V]MCA1281551.1 maleylpyruvate isomerase family mycothiol-dependent enzyme [Saccharopolyspora sp. 7B]